MKRTVKAPPPVVASSDWHRARRPEQKQVRKEAILAAACDLVVNEGVERTTLSAIARQANLSKANCYRYFENREAILLQVVLVETRGWTDAIVDDLSRLTSNSDLEAVAEVLVRRTLEKPMLCELVSSLWTVLEQNVSEEVLADFKREFRKMSLQWTGTLTDVLPSLSEDQAQQFSLFFLLFIASAWPASKPSKVMEQLMTREEFSNLGMDFETTLYAHTRTLFKGLLIS